MTDTLTDEKDERRMRLISVVRAYPATAFVVLTFLYSWGVFLLLYGLLGGESLTGSRWGQIPFAWGPPLAAIAVIRLRGGNVVEWLSAIVDPRTNPAWYLIAAALGFLLADTTSVLAFLAGTELRLATSLRELAFSFFVSLFLAGALEEFGWRGFAQAYLQERFDALVGAVIIGIIFGFWHAPWILLGGAGYGDGGVGPLLGLMFFGVLLSIVRAWLFNASGGVLPVVMLTHATINTGTVFEPVGQMPGWIPQTQLGLFLWIGLAVILIAVYGRAYLAPTSPHVPFVSESPERHDESEGITI